MLIHFGLFFAVGMSRHWGYMSSINDLGIFNQVVWNTLNGEFLRTTINPFGMSINWLGFHFQPILLLFVPLYRLYPGVAWFVAAQAMALAFTAWPIFLITKHLLKSVKVGFAWALVYLLNPFLLSAGTWDFHPITLAVPFIATGLLAVVKKNSRMLICSSLVILTCKEHLGLLVAGLGALWWIRNRSWKIAALVSSLGICYLVLVMGVLMPWFSPIGKPIMLGDGLGQLSRYSWLGGSASEIMHSFLTRPGYIWQQVVKMGGPVYWLLLLTPYGLVLPILGFPFLLPGLVDIAANTMSLNPMPRGWSYHSAVLVPIFTVAAIAGVEWMSRIQRRYSAKELSGLILTVALIYGFLFMPLPLKGAFDIWAPVNRFNWRAESKLQEVRSSVAGGVSLSAQANIGAHFSQRHEIFLYPNKAGKTDGVVLRLASPTTNINHSANTSHKHSKSWVPNWLEGHLQMDRTEYLASIVCLLKKKEYGIAYWDDPWLVLVREGKGEQHGVERKIQLLREEWQVDRDEYLSALAQCMADR